MSELTLTIIRLGLLVLLWVFVLSVAGALRGDLYGTRVSRRDLPGGQRRPASQGPPGAERRSGRDRRGSVPNEIVVTEGSLRGTALPLKGHGVLIGRNPECALILDDDFASGRHARIFPDGDGWAVEDLGSTNGTYLGDERLTTAQPLLNGSELRIGRTTIEARR